MELTLGQALQKGIEAHKAGKVEEADRYYTAIIKSNPNHPGANHNMGLWLLVLARLKKRYLFLREH